MEANLISDLNRALGKSALLTLSREEAAERKANERLEFLHRFDETVQQVVLPAVNEFSEELKKSGYALRVTSSSCVRPLEEGIVGYGGVFTHFISQPSTLATSTTPSMRFVSSDLRNELQVLGTCLEPQSGGREFNLGSYPLAKIDKTFVQGMLVQLVEGGLSFINYATRL